MLDLFLIVVAVELAIIILAWPEAREIAYWVVGLAAVAAGIMAVASIEPLAQWSTLTSWKNLEIAFSYAVGFAVFFVGLIACADAARGWVGERLLTKHSPEQPLWLLLAFVAMLGFVFSSIFVIGALEPESILDRRGKLEAFVGGGGGILAMLAWVAIGFRRLKRRGEEFQTLKAVKLLSAAVRPRRSKLDT